MKIKSFRKSGILSEYIKEKKNKEYEKKWISFIFILLMLRFCYMIQTKQINILDYLPYIMENEYGRRMINSLYTNRVD